MSRGREVSPPISLFLRRGKSVTIRKALEHLSLVSGVRAKRNFKALLLFELNEITGFVILTQKKVALLDLFWSSWPEW